MARNFDHDAGSDIGGIVPFLSRRSFAIGASVSVLLAGCDAGGEPSFTGDAPAAPSFLALSQRLTGYTDLAPRTAARMSQAFAKVFPHVQAHFAALASLTHAGMTPSQTLAAALHGGHGEAALAIVAAWYKGSLGLVEKAVTLAYADALMNRPVADVLAPPTYQFGGPGWWTAAPPPVGLPLPAERKPLPTPAHIVGKET